VIPERDFSSRRRRGRNPGEVALLAVAIALLAASVYATGSAWADARAARASFEEVRQEIAAADARAKALQPAGADGALGARAMWSAEAPPPRVVAALAGILPRDVRLETLTLVYDDELEVQLTLTARSSADYDRFLQALESSAAFDRVVLGEESRAAAVRASVRARYQGDEGS
jgi:Tfp pilus assembly protein PilN